MNVGSSFISGQQSDDSCLAVTPVKAQSSLVTGLLRFFCVRREPRATDRSKLGRGSSLGEIPFGFQGGEGLGLPTPVNLSFNPGAFLRIRMVGGFWGSHGRCPRFSREEKRSVRLTIAPRQKSRQTIVQSGEILDNAPVFAMVCEDLLASTKDDIYENDDFTALGFVNLDRKSTRLNSSH